MPIIIAHGVLGQYDELIYLGIAILFIGFMGLSWVRSRNQVFDDEESEAKPGEPAAPAEDSPDHFRLS
jgi:hypothetical protein